MDSPNQGLRIAPWLLGFDDARAMYLEQPQSTGWVARQMNELADSLGQSVRFEYSQDSLGALDYEKCVASGRIPTRDCAHDWYNAWVWLRYPAFKRALNLRHMAEAGKPAGANGRNRCRDAMTLFDENGLLLLTHRSELIGALHAFDWKALFCDMRPWWFGDVRVVVVGHGLLEALHRPYKGLCAKVRCVLLDPVANQVRTDDERLCIEVESLRTPAELLPLPVMGIPGWFSESAAPGFYDDPRVFRSKPTRRIESRD
ncbi:DUF3025 domain-containing protein [Limnobacter litoralis]|uniref:DUF3025 domain-containing protein n=1 Tax=Limnobacter litoralis TaxID=481366 RepID=UPI0024E15D51|nr:DUF3025 domain-containing protein [Limnobacter litoralis]